MCCHVAGVQTIRAYRDDARFMRANVGLIEDNETAW